MDPILRIRAVDEHISQTAIPPCSTTTSNAIGDSPRQETLDNIQQTFTANMIAKDTSPGTSTSITWGRRRSASTLSGIKAAALMLACPFLTLLLAINMQMNYGNLWQIFDRQTLHDFWQNLSGQDLLVWHKVIACFIVLQAALYQLLPGAYHTGQYTPGGQLLKYKTNGSATFITTYLLFWLGHTAGFYEASRIATDFSTLVVALNIWGLSLTVLVYIKALVYPTHLEDRVFTGNILYDLCMGVELNPHLPIVDDIKIFVVGRIGMTLWPLILTAFGILQHQNDGHLSMAMLVGIGLHFEYIIDFFWYEHWYLRTIDIAHDHVGFYIIWGCFAWLPSTYTLHAQFIGQSSLSASNQNAAICFAVGTAGYLLFRFANNEKYRVREKQGKCMVWNRPATYITARYATADGSQRESILLTCGWWGVARHINYVGDLVFSLAACAVTGFNGILPWFYAIYLWILLLHRCFRDEARCEKKYGKDWDKYCDQVRWRLVPYVV